MLEMYALAACHLRRLARNRELALSCALLAIVLGSLEAYGRINAVTSAIALLMASIAICLFRTFTDRGRGFEAGIVCTGLPRMLINAGRVLFAATLFLIFYVLRSVVFYIL